jgi:ankyrin repeat protein
MDSFGRNDLHYLILDCPESEHSQKIVSLISNGIDVNSQDEQGWTPLHFAAQECSVAGTKALLECGAKVDLIDSNGNTALFRAVFNSKGEGDIIELLLAAGSNPDQENEHGVSPRKLAETIGNYDVAQFFN